MKSVVPAGGLSAVFFDLDGTLLDSGPDLAAALSIVMRQEQRESLPYASVRPHVSLGARGLIELGFGTSLDATRFEALRDRFLEAYADNLCRESRLFPGIDAVLAELERRQLPWGIVTNKHARYTEPLLAALQLRHQPRCVISGDTAVRPKPDPEPLLLAARMTGVKPEACVYIGDDRRDVIAAKAAGMGSVVALYGYLGTGADPRTWQADGYLERPEQLLALLETV